MESIYKIYEQHRIGYMLSEPPYQHSESVASVILSIPDAHRDTMNTLLLETATKISLLMRSPHTEHAAKGTLYALQHGGLFSQNHLEMQHIAPYINSFNALFVSRFSSREPTAEFLQELLSYLIDSAVAVSSGQPINKMFFDLLLVMCGLQFIETDEKIKLGEAS